MSGAPIGNQNNKNAKIWQQAIKRSLARYSNESVDAGLDKLADKLIQACENGDSWALKELGDRTEGKPAQAITVLGDEDNPLKTSIDVTFHDGTIK